MKSILEEIQNDNSAQIDAFVLQSKNYRKCLSDVQHSLANLEYDLTEAQLDKIDAENGFIQLESNKKTASEKPKKIKIRPAKRTK